jgi:NAD(P)-dependent dehydrogenase (short-subunit alcohol dehydrogenase family)
MTTPHTAAHRTVVVTGASSGIGRAIAVACGARGWSVALGARRVDALEETAALVRDAGGIACAHALDVTSAASIDEFLAAVDDAVGGADVLVHNAGTASPGALHEMADDEHARILATNLLGPLMLTRRVVAAMLARGDRGDVVFVSSDATRRPRPYLGTYGASKAGLEAVARVLAMELEGTGIRSSIVRVGPTLTGFGEGWDVALFERLIPYWQHFGLQRHWGTLDPAQVADAVVQVVAASPGAHLVEVEVQPVAPSGPPAAT